MTNEQIYATIIGFLFSMLVATMAWIFNKILHEQKEMNKEHSEQFDQLKEAVLILKEMVTRHDEDIRGLQKRRNG